MTGGKRPKFTENELKVLRCVRREGVDCVEEGMREGMECVEEMCKEEGSASVEKDGMEQGMEGVDCVEEGRREGV